MKNRQKCRKVNQKSMKNVKIPPKMSKSRQKQ